ncbi:MAG TPA: metallophosphoesterase [Spirochaetia bacterium]|nr:metallophosphoesterase [Spirochaetia bacterium]
MPKASTRKSDYLKRLKEAVRNVLSFDSALRPPASDGSPGGLIEFPPKEKREFIIIGDLHGSHKNLRAILDHDKNLQKVKQDKAVIVFLGDAVHNDKTGFAYEMESSITTMDIIIDLINECPQNVVYLLGNHDSFQPELSKMGIQQGLLYRDALLEARGKQYVSAMQDFFDALPLFVIHRYFLAVHAGPVRGGVTRMELVNVRHFSNLVWQLTWNRLNETRSTPSMKEYGPEDLDEARRLLGCPSEIPIFVGHNPMWKWGEQDSIWIDALGTRHHVILYDTLETKCPYISVKGSFTYKVKYADLAIAPRRFVLDDYR